MPLNATDLDTGAFMLGDVYVTVVFFESQGSVSTEDWDNTQRDEVKVKINDALQWWEDALAQQTSVPNQTLNFQIDYQYADNPIPVNVEPIANKASDLADWVGPFLDTVGAERTSYIENDVRRFNNSQRIAHDTNWAFTIFVINSQNDADGLFAPGSVRGGFSLAGGSFFAIPSTRPTSSMSHEVAHQFWAMDEYTGSGGTYTDTRGYYNTQNTNAIDGAPVDAPHQDSLLGNQTEIATVYPLHTSSTSSFESIGWKDSDGDGIFDVFDVPISFSASSTYDSQTSQLHIVGKGAIGVLPNMNSWGQQSSMTINKLSYVEYRVDGGDWQTGPTIDDYTADLDFSLAMPDSGQHTVDVRLVDKTGAIYSDVFHASTADIGSTAVHGVTGFVAFDQSGNGSFDTGEQGLAGWNVQLANPQGQPIASQVTIDPDDYYHTQVLTDAINGVTLRSVGESIQQGYDYVSTRDSSLTSTGQLGFFNYINNAWSNLWSYEHQLKISFDTPVSRVAIDAIGHADGDVGILELYDASGNLLDRYTTGSLANGESETMTVELPTANAAYAIARGALDPSGDRTRVPKSVALDNLVVGRPSSTVTNAMGAFTLPVDDSGNYQVIVTPPTGQEAYFDTSSPINVSLASDSQLTGLGFVTSIAAASWHNPILSSDVNHDNVVDQNDASMLLDELLTHASTGGSQQIANTHTTNDPYFDVNGDGRLSNSDFLELLDALADQSASQTSLAGEPIQVQLTTSPTTSNPTTSSTALTVEAESSDPLPATSIASTTDFIPMMADNVSTPLTTPIQSSSETNTSPEPPLASEGSEAALTSDSQLNDTILSQTSQSSPAQRSQESTTLDSIDEAFADPELAWSIQDDLL